jgi:hypothetical protein
MTRQDVSDSLPLDAVWAGYELKFHPMVKPPWPGYLFSRERTVLTLNGSFVREWVGTPSLTEVREFMTGLGVC